VLDLQVSKNDGKSPGGWVLTQNPAGLPPRVGSIPTSGTNDFDNPLPFMLKIGC
jgi:hypothetical protein